MTSSMLVNFEHLERMKWVKKEKLYTHLMIETRLMIPETISMIQDCFDEIN